MSIQAQLRFNTHISDETYIWRKAQKVLECLPEPHNEVMPGLKWGSIYQLYTPAFWKYQYLINKFPSGINVHRLSECVREEIVMCMLGGYGIPSEMGLLAFERLKSERLIVPYANFDHILTALSSSFYTPGGNNVKYRFARQKASYIYEFLNRPDIEYIPSSNDLAFREWLTTVKGIGYKTASWITRNWLRSENVAILDIHLLRAGVITGFFHPDYNLNSEYLALEQRFLIFCKKLDVRPSDMDAIIWQYMKKNNRLALNILASIL